MADATEIDGDKYFGGQHLYLEVNRVWFTFSMGEENEDSFQGIATLYSDWEIQLMSCAGYAKEVSLEFMPFVPADLDRAISLSERDGHAFPVAEQKRLGLCHLEAHEYSEIREMRISIRCLIRDDLYRALKKRIEAGKLSGLRLLIGFSDLYVESHKLNNGAPPKLLSPEEKPHHVFFVKNTSEWPQDEQGGSAIGVMESISFDENNLELRSGNKPSPLPEQLDEEEVEDPINSAVKTLQDELYNLRKAVVVMSLLLFAILFFK